jgi:hypothetical protein
MVNVALGPITATCAIVSLVILVKFAIRLLITVKARHAPEVKKLLEFLKGICKITFHLKVFALVSLICGLVSVHQATGASAVRPT